MKNTDKSFRAMEEWKNDTHDEAKESQAYELVHPLIESDVRQRTRGQPQFDSLAPDMGNDSWLKIRNHVLSCQHESWNDRGHCDAIINRIIKQVIVDTSRKNKPTVAIPDSFEEQLDQRSELASIITAQLLRRGYTLTDVAVFFLVVDGWARKEVAEGLGLDYRELCAQIRRMIKSLKGEL